MTTPAYSTRFVLAVDNTALTYTTPPGKRAVVKWVSCYNTTTAAETVALSVAGRTVWRRSCPGASSIDNANMMAIGYAGELIEISHSNVGLRTMCCGYLLSET